VKLSLPLCSEEARRRQAMPIVALPLRYPRFFSSIVLECHRQGECVSILSKLFLKQNVLYGSLDVAMSPTLSSLKYGQRLLR
jgi:hypothetical protein